MADLKISALPASSVPLVGTEVLPIVQSSTTKQVSVANLTAGRVVAGSNFVSGYTAVTSAGGTTVLTVASNYHQKLLGSSAQTFQLPDATTIAAGTAYLFDNDSSGVLTVVDNASGAVTTVNAGSIQYVFLETAGTAAGAWGKYAWVGGAGALTVTTAKSASITNSLTLSGTDATVMTFPTTTATIARTDAAQSFTGDQTLATGNIIQGTAAKGVNFTANTPAAGMTTQLLNWYEQGTWTPSIGGSATYTLQTGTYTRIGRLVFVSAVLQINAIGTGSVNTISGLPFTRDANNNQAPGSMTFISAISSTVSMLVPVVQVNTATVIFQGLTVVGNTTSQINVFQNGARVDFQITYQT